MRKTTTQIYRNNRNQHKYIEVHADGYSHWTVRQYLFWPSTMVKNFTGDSILYRWRKANLQELLEDYTLVERR